jgi:hypothetical protein
VIRQKIVDSIIPSPEQVLELIAHIETRRKIVWTAGRVLKEAVMWSHLGELDYEEQKMVGKRITEILNDLASQGILRRRPVPQSIGYGYEVGFDYVPPQTI